MKPLVKERQLKKFNTKVRIEKAMSLEKSVKAFEQKLRHVTIQEDEEHIRHAEGNNKKNKEKKFRKT